MLMSTENLDSFTNTSLNTVFSRNILHTIINNTNKIAECRLAQGTKYKCPLLCRFYSFLLLSPFLDWYICTQRVISGRGFGYVGHMSRDIHYFFLPSLPKRVKDRQRETPQADRVFNIKPLDGETVTLFQPHEDD